MLHMCTSEASNLHFKNFLSKNSINNNPVPYHGIPVIDIVLELKCRKPLKRVECETLE